KWIDLQLHPEKIDDSGLQARLAPFRTLRMNTREIVENFPNNQIIKQVAEGKEPMPTDPARRAVSEDGCERYEGKAEGKAKSQKAAKDDSAADKDAAGEKEPKVEGSDSSDGQEAHANIKLRELLDLPPEERYRKILSLSTEEQRMIANRSRGAQG